MEAEKDNGYHWVQGKHQGGDLMTPALMLDFVMEIIKELGTAEQVRSNRIRIVTTPEKVRNVISRTMEVLGCDRLVTISAVDNGRTLELIYHLIGPHRTVVSVMIDLPRDSPRTVSVSDILPPAGIYERQIHDLFGISFPGHPGLKKIILNEDWPADEYPLRKDWEKRPDAFYGGIKEEKI
jgi:NADH:ubiquinone oxidoreductase subunit C